MTGFGREVLETGRERITAEVRSVNGRGLKLSVRLPDSLLAFQTEVESLVRTKVDRGSVHVELEYRPLVTAESYGVNAALLTALALEVRAVKTALGVDTPLDVERLVSAPGVIVPKAPPAEEASVLWARVRGVVEKTVAALLESRLREGAVLTEDLRARRRAIGERLTSVKARLPEVVAGFRKKLEDRMTALLTGSGVTPEPSAVLREAALLAERADVSEEISRLDAHLNELDRVLAEAGPVGRRLEFLAQEMLREANTMGSKSQESALIHDILAIKLEIDKIKEQTANAE